MRTGAPLSAREARSLAVGAQGLGADRPSPGARRGPAQLRRLLDGLGALQLDAVNVLERTQFVVPFSRLGPYDRSDLLGLCGPGGSCFEYWGHAASLQPVESYPLFRWRMDEWRDGRHGGPTGQARRRQWREHHARYLAAVLAEVTERGALAASQLAEPRRNEGEWWERRSDGRRALEVLFADGVLAAWRNPNFERVYDLTERVIPARLLDAPAPDPDEAQRELVAIAARCLGVATATDLADYFWLAPASARLRVAELVEAGRLLPVDVEGWDQPGYTPAGARPRAPRRRHATLLSPFDSLIWNRARTERLFAFRYRIEIYVPEPQRTHGYYVLPLLLSDGLVARFGLKADRRASTLRVTGSYLEPAAEVSAVLEPAAAELGALRDWLGLEHIDVADRGDLAPRSGARSGNDGGPQSRPKKAVSSETDGGVSDADHGRGGRGPGRPGAARPRLLRLLRGGAERRRPAVVLPAAHRGPRPRGHPAHRPGRGRAGARLRHALLVLLVSLRLAHRHHGRPLRPA